MKIQSGFSLVELMIAIALGLLLTGAVISAFVGIKSAASTTSGVASIADGGRAALDTLQQSLRGAGYIACGSMQPNSSPDPGAQTASTVVSDLQPGTSPIFYDYGEPISGYEFKGTGPSGTYAIPPTITTDNNVSHWVSGTAQGSNLDPALKSGALFVNMGGVAPGNDVIVIHGTPSNSATAYLALPGNIGDTALTTYGIATNPPNPDINFVPGSIVAISNCQFTELFQIASTSWPTINLGGTTPGNTSAGLQRQHGAGSRVSIVNTIVYYIGVGNDGDGALFSLDMQGTGAFQQPVEIVSDIENMQVLYGVDVDGTYRVGQYVTADQVATTGITGDFNSVINVKIALLAAGPPGSAPLVATSPQYKLLGTTITPPVDNRLRKAFEMTVAVRNTAP